MTELNDQINREKQAAADRFKNHFLVGGIGGNVAILNEVSRVLTREQALNLVCWIVIVSRFGKWPDVRQHTDTRKNHFLVGNVDDKVFILEPIPKIFEMYGLANLCHHLLNALWISDSEVDEYIAAARMHIPRSR